MREWTKDENIKVLFDGSKLHRFKLTCQWDDTLSKCLYIMLNPSTAVTEKCDPTLGRCISFARSNEFGSITVVNLYSFQTASPKVLWEADVQSLSENVSNVKQSIDKAVMIIGAWGVQIKKDTCFSWVLDYVKASGKSVHCLGKNKNGTPKHPLYLKNDILLEEYL